MPYANHDEQKRAQREYYYRKKERIARGEIPKPSKKVKPKPKPVPVPKSLRNCAPLVRKARENHAAWDRYQSALIRKQSWQMTPRDEAKNAAALAVARPHPDAPLLDVSCEMLPRALLLLHAIIRKLSRTRRSMELVSVDYGEGDYSCGPTIRLRLHDDLFDLTIYEESKRAWQVVDDEDAAYPWAHKEQVPNYQGILAVRAGERCYRDTAKSAEERLGYLFRELPDQIKERKRAEKARIKWEADAPKREAQQRRDEIAAQKAKEEQEERDRLLQEQQRERSRQLEEERQRLERIRRVERQRDQELVNLVCEHDEANLVEQLLAVLASRADERATEWVAWARKYLPELDPIRPTSTEAAASTVAVEEWEVVSIEDVEPVPEPRQEPPPLPETLRGAPKVITKLKQNYEAQARHRRYQHRNSCLEFSRHFGDKYRAGLKKLGPERPHPDVPVLDLPREYFRSALLMLNAVVMPAAKMGYEVDAEYDFMNRRHGLRIHIGTYEIPVSISHARQRTVSPSLVLRVGRFEDSFHNFDQMKGRYEEIVRLPLQFAREQREQRRAEHESYLRSKQRNEREAAAKRARSLERYRQNTLRTLALNLRFASIARDLAGRASMPQSAHDVLGHAADWIERHDPASIELPVFTPGLLPAEHDDEPPPPAPRWESSYAESKSYWQKSWWQRR